MKFDYEVDPPTIRRREERDVWSAFRAFMASLWATFFVLFTSDLYVELAGWAFVVLIWGLVFFGSAGAAIAGFVRSGSIGHRHRRARTLELVAACMAMSGWVLYVLLTIVQMVAFDDPVPAIWPFGEWGVAGPTRLAVMTLGIIMVGLTLERIRIISRLIGIELAGTGRLTI